MNTLAQGQSAGILRVLVRAWHTRRADRCGIRNRRVSMVPLPSGMPTKLSNQVQASSSLPMFAARIQRR